MNLKNLYNESSQDPVSVCLICKRKIGGERGYVAIEGGAWIDRQWLKPRYRSNNLSGWLSIKRAGVIKKIVDDYGFVSLPIIENVHVGQWEFYFCSKNCLLKFFKDAITKLDEGFTKESDRIRKAGVKRPSVKRGRRMQAS